jgi:hypothetical protein
MKNLYFEETNSTETHLFLPVLCFYYPESAIDVLSIPSPLILSPRFWREAQITNFFGM